MASVYVFWTEKGLNFDEDSEYAIDEKRQVHTGVLTDEAENATDEIPVVIEDETGRIYLPDDFAPDTILYVEAAEEGMPAIAEAAVEAGFHVAHADDRGLIGPEVAPRINEDEIDPDDLIH